jgi:D-alanyl-lipoteichoic acid acyltransferase DltB (MBOAT superfamily)
MLFNSHVFIFLFLPITLLIFFAIGHHGLQKLAIAWLIVASLFFYAWWNPVYLSLLVASILCNYALGWWLNRKRTKMLLILGIMANLALLGYYKYANFFLDNLNYFAATNYPVETILLPLAISFFTFQQIAYLVDSYHGNTQTYHFLHYGLFVTFFPQLIAGPIVYHREIFPQITNSTFARYQPDNLSIGLTIFFAGLFKKVVLADNIALFATPVFEAAEQGTALSLLEAWGGVLAYTFQLYFDFSGYSDMAVGLARMFGIVLPINFYSPYKSVNIIEFWQRWHITLSRFLRDYLYIPLGGNRKSIPRRFSNLILTMFLGGLWHGAGWTFVLWGLLHGIYLVINHFWRLVRKRLKPKGGIQKKRILSGWGRMLSISLTFIAVTIAWVLFRAESLEGAIAVYKGMLGMNGLVIPNEYLVILGSYSSAIQAWGITFGEVGLFDTKQLIGLLLLFAIVWLMPNIYQMMEQFKPVILTYPNLILQPSWLRWQPTRRWATAFAVIAAIAILSLTRISEFLYFQF